MPSPTGLRIVPASAATWGDLAAIFGTRGVGSRCFCQRYKLARGESFGSFPAEERAWRLQQQTRCGGDGEGGDGTDGEGTCGAEGQATTSGLVAYLDGEPVGWCAVEPRSAYRGLVRVFTAPWKGREEDREDPTVWAVTCLFVRAGRRRRGISRALALAAVEHARGQGARALEAYPITTTAVIEEELHVGTVGTFEAAGMTQVSSPTPRRVVMRIEFRRAARARPAPR